ncbi:MAG TPA: hypothetical protein VFN87_09005, partial [Solirubrobacteraceae bacterium]|nr:hypothetical protein [Solirubrobacteraceae bacterium]
RLMSVLWLAVGIIAAGAGTAAASSQMRFAVTPRRVNPGGAVTLHVAAHQRRCRLSITDRGRLIYEVAIPRGHTRLPFSARSAPGRLVLHVRCGRRTISRRLSVVRRSHHRHKPRGTHRPAHQPSGSPQPPVTPTPPPRPTGSGPVTVTAPPVTTPPAPVAATPSPGGGQASAPSGGPNGSGGSDSPGGSGGSDTAPGTPAPPTTAETAAVRWAAGWLGRRAFVGQSLLFTYLAYAQGAGVDLRSRTGGVDYTPFTGPQDVWGHTAAGSTGTGAPPFGALVFFTVRSDPAPLGFRSPQDRGPDTSPPPEASGPGTVAIMGAQGEMIAVPDAVDETAVHQETLAQATAPGSRLIYAGWWLPDR